MRKPLMALAIAACLVMSVVGGFVPILQGWIFFVIAPLSAGDRVRDRPSSWVDVAPVGAGPSSTAGS